MSNESHKSSLKSFEKNLKKFLTRQNERDKINELSRDGETKNLDN